MANRTVLLDIEANGFTPDTIHFVVCRDYETDEVNVFRNPERDPSDFLRYMDTVRTIVGHHILGYDLPVLSNLVSGWMEVSNRVRKIDTLVLSRLLDNNILGGHSIEAWGIRLGIEKQGTDITDWSVPTENMKVRCLSDTLI